MGLLPEPGDLGAQAADVVEVFRICEGVRIELSARNERDRERAYEEARRKAEQAGSK